MWARSRQHAVRVAGMVGFGPRDLVLSAPVVLTPRWQKIMVPVIPRRAAAVADIGIQSRVRKPVSFDIDGVLVSAAGVPGGGPPTAREEARAFQAARYADPLPAQSLGAESGSRTLLAALAGGATGLLAALASLAAVLAARRRREQYSE